MELRRLLVRPATEADLKQSPVSVPTPWLGEQSTKPGAADTQRRRDRYLAGVGGLLGLLHPQRATAERVLHRMADLAPKAVGVGPGEPITENAAETVRSLL